MTVGRIEPVPIRRWPSRRDAATSRLFRSAVSSPFDESRLLAKLRGIEALFAGATTEGERAAATEARTRIQLRLRDLEVGDPPVEYRFIPRRRLVAQAVHRALSTLSRLRVKTSSRRTMSYCEHGSRLAEALLRENTGAFALSK
jgi:hypothetical protein